LKEIIRPYVDKQYCFKESSNSTRILTNNSSTQKDITIFFFIIV